MTGVGQDGERLEPPRTLVGVRDGRAAMENSMEAPHDTEIQSHRMTQQAHFWA